MLLNETSEASGSAFRGNLAQHPAFEVTYVGQLVTLLTIDEPIVGSTGDRDVERPHQLTGRDLVRKKGRCHDCDTLLHQRGSELGWLRTEIGGPYSRSCVTRCREPVSPPCFAPKELRLAQVGRPPEAANQLGTADRRVLVGKETNRLAAGPSTGPSADGDIELACAQVLEVDGGIEPHCVRGMVVLKVAETRDKPVRCDCRQSGNQQAR